MSRKRFFLAGLTSSYLMIGLNFMLTVISVPLALQYLTKAEFGVWALVTQFSAYLLLVDMGVSASIARLLADHKDDKTGPEYSRVFFSSFFVSGAQGLVLLGLGALAAWFAPALANIPNELRPVFSRILIGHVAVTAVCLVFRSLASPLWSHQRLDISNLGNAMGLVMNLIGLWAGLHSGMGLYGLLFGTVIGALPGLVIPFAACRFYGYYPPWPGLSHLGKTNFRELLCLSRDIFIFQLGSQMASATQIVLVSRFLSVESAAVWAIATKALTLGQQLCNRVMDASAAALTEMFVRGEDLRFRARFRDAVEITAWLAVMVGLAIVFFNTPFIDVWTGGKIIWPADANVWLAFLLLSTSVARCHLSLGGIVKQLSSLRWVQLVEASVMIGSGIFFIQRLGIGGILAASLLASAGVSLLSATVLSAKKFSLPSPMVLGWLFPAAVFLCAGSLLAWGLNSFAAAWIPRGWGLLADGCAFLLLGFSSFKICLRPEIQSEILRLLRLKSG